MAQWIDFKQLRAQIKFEDVLRLYNVEIKLKKGGQHHGFCPIPSHEGKRNSESFSANLDRGIFNCFGCGAKGNVIDFAVIMEGLNPKSGEDVRRVAIGLQEKLGISTAKRERSPENRNPDQPDLPHAKPDVPVVVNSPLDFELKNLDPKHRYLDKRGFEQQTIAHFGLGFCSKGLLAGRIAIPIRNQKGELVGYAGRLVDDSKITDENPRYKFPPKRQHKGILYEFHKVELLYNAHCIQKPTEELVIVEGFASVWWMHQMGIHNVVALMGWTCSNEQTEIVCDLVPPEGRIWLIPDGDDSGERCVQSVSEHIGTKRFLKWVKLDEGKQPTDYPAAYFAEAFS